MSAPPAPYPPDIRAKGWRFELDMERARQSDTWTLAPPEVRPWLLMAWATAWEQTPCGSLPNDDELIAARIGMPAKLFAKYRALLLRKWWLADDGRLYHDVLVQRVMEMMQCRRKESDRKALARLRNTPAVPQESADVPRDNHGTTTGIPGVSTRCPIPEPEPEPTTNKTPPPPTADAAGGAFGQFWDAYPKTPRKVAQAQCRAKWRTKGCEPIAATVLAALDAAKASAAWAKDGGEFIPSPLVWLNQARWGAPTEAQAAAEQQADHWRESRSGIERKGQELGIGPWCEEMDARGYVEPFATYSARVFRAAGETVKAVAAVASSGNLRRVSA